MKKLMFALAAAASVVAFADVTSGVVGYTTESLKDNNQMVAPIFVSVSEDGVATKLSDIKLGGTYEGGDIIIQVLDEHGFAAERYTLMSNRAGDKWWWTNKADDEIKPDEVTFVPGQGLWITAVKTATATFSGAVSTDEVVIPLVDGSVATGNSTAVPVSLGDIDFTGTFEGGDIIIQVLDEHGFAAERYTRMSNRAGDKWWWTNKADDKINADEVTFAPGQGLWVTGVEGAYMHIPGPTL